MEEKLRQDGHPISTMVCINSVVKTNEIQVRRQSVIIDSGGPNELTIEPTYVLSNPNIKDQSTQNSVNS
jgi:hypothetical protein